MKRFTGEILECYYTFIFIFVLFRFHSSVFLLIACDIPSVQMNFDHDYFYIVFYPFSFLLCLIFFSVNFRDTSIH